MFSAPRVERTHVRNGRLATRLSARAHDEWLQGAGACSMGPPSGLRTSN